MVLISVRTVFASSIQGVLVFGHPERNFSDRTFCSTPLKRGAQDD